MRSQAHVRPFERIVGIGAKLLSHIPSPCRIITPRLVWYWSLATMATVLPGALAAHLSISASFCAGSVAALISVSADPHPNSSSEPKIFPILLRATESAAQAIPSTKGAPQQARLIAAWMPPNGPVARPKK